MSAAAIRDLVAEIAPGMQVERMEEIGADASGGDATRKGAGYGRPLRLVCRGRDGARATFVFRTASADWFGHDRRSDRAAGALLAFDSYGEVPRHVAAVDVGAIAAGRLVSLRAAGEFYLITRYGEGVPYAHDLRRIAREGFARAIDVRRCRLLADYLAALHSNRGGAAQMYRRAIRDLVGHGEGIFGIVDGYARDVPAASAGRLKAIESACATWRWRLRGHADRLARTHGDFHPFNILFDHGDQLVLLDTSRGSRGDPADDISCIAINYIFFALSRPSSWPRGFRPLWREVWERYVEQTGDVYVFEAAPPFLAWRALVLANPAWYPNVTGDERDALLRLVEKTLAAGRLYPAAAEELFL